MRVCVVSSYPPTIAGVADYGAHVSQHLAHDPRIEKLTVLADRAKDAPGQEQVGRVNVHRVWQRDRVGTGLALVRAIKTLRPDVVWFNLRLMMFGTRPTAAASGLIAPLWTTLLGYRTVVTLHELPALADLTTLGLGTGAGRVGAALIPRVVLRADTVIVTLDRYRRFLVERYKALNVRRIPHGTYGAPVCLDEPKQETVLVFGLFGPHKDPGFVAEAVAHVRQIRPAVRLIVAGADHPRYPGFMADCCARHSLDGSWIGYVPAERVGALFAKATIVVIPSRASTGSSSVIYRAMSHGRAVLASDLLDFRGLAQDEDLDVAWFSSGDAAGLACALEALLADHERRRAAVRHNLQAIKRLGPAQIVDAYLAVFDDQDRTEGRSNVSTGSRPQPMEAGGDP